TISTITSPVSKLSPAYCRNITWSAGLSGTPVFISSEAYPIVIAGSFTVEQGSEPIFAASNAYYFVADKNADITTSGRELGSSATAIFASRDDLNVTWTLQDSLLFGTAENSNAWIRLNCGNLNLNGKNLITGVFTDDAITYSRYNFAFATGARAVNIANSTVTARIGWRYNAANSTVLTAANTANSTIKIPNASYRYTSTLPRDFMGRNSDIYYNLEFTPIDNRSYYNNTGTTNSSYAMIENGRFNKITLLGTNLNPTLLSFEQTDSLLLTQDVGAGYYVRKDLTVNKYLGNTRACGTISLLRSIGSSSNFTINMGANATVALRNMQIGGTAIDAVTAQYGVNISGADMPAGGYPVDDCVLVQGTGWNVTIPAKRSWYWVGGSGNWIDINHWSASPTGVYPSTDGPCQPPANPDNVIFNDNSFTDNDQVVTMTVNATCDSMIWKGSTFATRKPQLHFGAIASSIISLSVYGSFALDTGVFVSYNGYKDNAYAGGLWEYKNLYLYSTRPHETFKTAGQKMATIINFFSTSTWDIPDGIEVNGDIHFGTNANTYANAVYNFGDDLINPDNPDYSSSSSGQYNNEIFLLAGTLNMNGHNIVTNHFASAGGNGTQRLNIKNSTVEVQHAIWSYNGILTAEDSENSEINFTCDNFATTMTTGKNQVYNNVNFKSERSAMTLVAPADQTTQFRNVTFARTGTITANANAALANRPVFGKVEFLSENTANTIFSTITGGTYQYLKLNGNGLFNQINADTLQFAYKNSMQYRFTAGETSYINQAWYASGNSCADHEIRSSIDGTKANVSVHKNAATIKAENAGEPDTLYLDHIYLRDILAVTGADRAILRKGILSSTTFPWGQPATVAESGNPNWTLDTYLGAVGFQGLGKDISLSCSQYPYVLNTVYFLPNPESTFEWHKLNPDGTINPAIISTEPTYIIHNESETGAYYCIVEYTNNCNLNDTVQVLSIPGKETIEWTGAGGNINYYNPNNWKYPNDPRYDGFVITENLLRGKCLQAPRYWWYISSPYTSFHSGSFVHDTTLNKIGYYTESTAQYGTPPLVGNVNFNDKGRGFAALLYAMPKIDYFKGSTTPNTGDISVSVSNKATGSFAGFNLMGNPYSSAISADKFLDANEQVIWKHLWYRSHNPNNLSILGWEYYCIDDGFAEQITTYADPTTLDTIGLMQAFWVRVRSALPQDEYHLSFSENMRLNGNGILRSPQANSKANQAKPEPRQAVRLQVSTDIYHDATLLVFKPSGTMHENNVDMKKMANEHNFIPEIFSTKNNTERAISKYPTIVAGMSLDIGFRTGVQGKFTVSATELVDIPKNISILLRDNVSGDLTDLTVGESYTFTSAETNNAQRFSLQFVSNTTGFDHHEPTAAFAYVDDKNHIVALGVVDNKITLYDALGRTVTDQYANSDRWTYEHSLTAGVYLLKITDKNNVVKTNKLIIK
ncbi:MAG: T9SS type A sorting domain-containing protein, partial [Paludibacter sp.]|nr:T9SS type A sorting domain-containing protein [Paludibacter sp.]